MAAIRLEPLTAAHFAGIAELAADPEVARFTRMPSPTSPGQPREWLDGYQDGARQGRRAAFAIVDGDGHFVGVAVAPRIDREAATVELGYVVAAAHRGRGVATEALRLLSEWAFAELGVLRLELRIDVRNEASKRVAARGGYLREGTLRSLRLERERRADTEIWSRLPAEA